MRGLLARLWASAGLVASVLILLLVLVTLLWTIAPVHAALVAIGGAALRGVLVLAAVAIVLAVALGQWRAASRTPTETVGSTVRAWTALVAVLGSFVLIGVVGWPLLSGGRAGSPAPPVPRLEAPGDPTSGPSVAAADPAPPPTVPWARTAAVDTLPPRS